METTEIRLPGADGLSLAADARGSRDDPAVVLLHGGGQTRHSWAETAESLARAGWYAVSVDLRGHGDSDWSPTGDYTHTSFTRDVVALAQAFDDPPTLVGASLGGISSLLAIGSCEVQIARALVLVDIATRMELSGAARIVEFMGSRPDGFVSLEEAADAIAAYNPHRPRPRDLTGLAKNLRQHEDGRWRWHWDPAFMSRRELGSGEGIHDPELLDRAAAQLVIPTLLVRGRLSDLLSEEGARHFLDLVPHAAFADVSGAGHMVAGDKNTVFATSVLDFLEEQVRNAGAPT